jgi:hypothetical protein
VKLSNLLSTFVLAVAALTGCGGIGDNSDTGSIRLINATTDYSALDLYVADAKVLASTGSFTGSDFVSVDSGSSQTFKLTQAGSTTAAYQTTSASVTTEVSYSLVAYVTNSTLQMLTISENQSEPSSGNGQLRVLNTSAEVGAVDIYAVASAADLTGASPIASNVSTSASSGYVDVSKGTYRLVVTAYQDKSDIRLDIPSFTLADKQIVNLVLTKTSGGVLANAMAIVQGGTVTAYKNSSARMRLVANVAASGVVTATVNGVTLGSAMTSPAVNSAYSLVPTGSLGIAATVNGSAVTTPTNLVAAAGEDITLLVMGSASAPSFVAISDDNTLATSGYSKIRLLNAINGLASGLTLTVDYSDVASAVTPGSASTAQKVGSGTGINVVVTASGSSSTLWSNTDDSLASGSVYTIFMLGDSDSSIGFQKKDR